MTDARDEWVKACFGADPVPYPHQSPHQSPHKSASPTPPAGSGAAEPAGSAPAPGGTPMRQFNQRYAAAKPALDKAQVHAVVPAWAAAEAQQRLVAELAEMNAAVQKKDWAAALKQLDAAIKDSAVVLRSKDPAMVTPRPGKHGDQVLYGKEAGARSLREYADPAEVKPIRLPPGTRAAFGHGEVAVLAVEPATPDHPARVVLQLLSKPAG